MGAMLRRVMAPLDISAVPFALVTQHTSILFIKFVPSVQVLHCTAFLSLKPVPFAQATQYTSILFVTFVPSVQVLYCTAFLSLKAVPFALATPHASMLSIRVVSFVQLFDCTAFPSLKAVPFALATHYASILFITVVSFVLVSFSLDDCCFAGSVLLLQLCTVDSAGDVPSVCIKGGSAPTQHRVHHQAGGRNPHKCRSNCNARSHSVFALLLRHQAVVPRHPCASTPEGQASSRCGSGCL